MNTYQFDLEKEHYRNWEGRPVSEVFRTLGLANAKKIYSEKRSLGLSMKEAFQEVYAMEVHEECKQIGKMILSIGDKR